MDILEKIREMLEAGKISKEDIERAFPELKESEDERIREGIVETIRQCTDILDPKNQKLMLDWLEKQKEQKPNPYSGTGFDYSGHYWGMCARDGGIEIIVDGKIRDRVFFESENIERSDSVAKEMFIKALERAVEQTKKGYELTDCDKHSWWEDFKAYSGIKPAEWSEIEQNVIDCAVDVLEKELPSLAASLKSLRPQPHWKPREEQIDALERAIVKMHTPNDIGILAELRDNLKKL